MRGNDDHVGLNTGAPAHDGNRSGKHEQALPETPHGDSVAPDEGGYPATSPAVGQGASLSAGGLARMQGGCLFWAGSLRGCKATLALPVRPPAPHDAVNGRASSGGGSR